ncbi:hypothetical protein ACHAC9_24215 [Massilia sp. CMS3.1]|uniref:hypothetical protein n=1 Tax=Massilia sp. CMS3.1 TaxID=3373083 RepID=UPI003EE4B097
MDALSVTIERFVDDNFPGWVECSLVDSDRCVHQFIQKAPVVSAANLVPDSDFPHSGYMACLIQDEWTDERGRQLVRVGTAKPWGVESTAGETSFTVLRAQIVQL